MATGPYGDIDLRIYTNLARRASVLCLLAAGSVAFLGASGCDNPNGAGVTDTGSITGRLVDARTQQPISTVTIAVGASLVRRLSAADQGGFTLTDVPTGTQRVHITAIGYDPVDIPVVVRKGQSSDIGNGNAYGLVSTAPQ